MNHRSATFAVFAAFSLLLTRAAQATGTGPITAQNVRPAPTRRPAVARPAAAAPAPEAAPVAPKPEAAPHSVLVAGTIVGTDGKPCPGACVFPTSNPRLIAVTDAMGTFRLQVPAAAGSFSLQADYFGVGSSRVAVDGQHPQPISIVLGK